MFYFPDSDTGYYDTESAFDRRELELERIAEEREARLEAQAEEMHLLMWSGERLEEPVDPETACTAAEMKEGEWVDRKISPQSELGNSEGKVA